MKTTARQYAQALHEVLDSTSPSDQDKILDNFVEVLVENNDLKLFDSIASEFHKTELEKKGIKQVNVTSANPLNAGAEQALIESLNKHIKGKLELKKSIDENLIGGVIIQADDTLIDASVKTALEQLKKELSN